MERQMIYRETVSDVAPVFNSDNLDVVTVRGWKVVVRRGEFAPGQEVVYAEVDAALPLEDPRFSFLEPRGVKIVDGKNVHVLRTIRLRGQISQGLVLPAEQFSAGLPEIEKYDPPIPMSGEDIVGRYPHEWAIKTDAERIQNLGAFIDQINALTWTATEKIDGTSTTFINDNGKLRIASRNWELDVNPELLRYKVAQELDLLNTLPEGHAIQGELFGPGIQSNPLGRKSVEFRAFNLFTKGNLIPYSEWPQELVAIRVPTLDLALPDTVESIVEQADGIKSAISPDRRAEGIVWHCGVPQEFLGTRDGFKAISNTYLAKLKD